MKGVRTNVEKQQQPKWALFEEHFKIPRITRNMTTMNIWTIFFFVGWI